MRDLRRRRDLISSEETNTDFRMAEDLAEDRLSRRGGAPLKVAIAVAVLGVLGMLIVDHGPWNKPKVQPAFMASHSSTGEAARAAGAQRLTRRANHWHSGIITEVRKFPNDRVSVR